MTLAQRIAVARGDIPAQLILRNAQLVNVLSGGRWAPLLAVLVK